MILSELFVKTTKMYTDVQIRLRTISQSVAFPACGDDMSRPSKIPLQAGISLHDLHSHE